MNRRHAGNTPARVSLALAIIVLSGTMLLGVVPQQALSSSGLSSAAPGWINGRVFNTVTSSGLAAAISVSGPVAWAGGTDANGYYSVQLPPGMYTVTVSKETTLATKTGVHVVTKKTTTVDFQVAYTPPAPVADPVPPPPPPPAPDPEPEATTEEAAAPAAMPAPDPSRRPQILTTAVNSGDMTDSNVYAYADQYDVLTHYVPSKYFSILRTRNPDMVILGYRRPHAPSTTSWYPDSYFVKDAKSGTKVSRDGWYLLDFRQSVVRAAAIQRLLSGSTGLDGWWIDMTGAALLNLPFSSTNLRDAYGNLADLGNLDGGWYPLLSVRTKPDYTDGVWPARMMNFHTDLAAIAPTSIRLYNGLQPSIVYYSSTFWRDYEAAYISTSHGAIKEGVFVSGPTTAQGETEWRFFLNRAEAIMAAGKIMHFWPLANGDPLRTFAFGSYLLVADGKYAWFRVNRNYYSSTLYDRDYGMPEGHYSIISTTNGRVYKREFANATVWVNPGAVTRYADGLTLAPKTAVIKMK